MVITRVKPKTAIAIDALLSRLFISSKIIADSVDFDFEHMVSY